MTAVVGGRFGMDAIAIISDVAVGILNSVVECGHAALVDCCGDGRFGMDAIAITSFLLLTSRVSPRMSNSIVTYSGYCLLLLGYLIVYDNRILLLLSDHCCLNPCLLIATINCFSFTASIDGTNVRTIDEWNYVESFVEILWLLLV